MAIKVGTYYISFYTIEAHCVSDNLNAVIQSGKEFVFQHDYDKLLTPNFALYSVTTGIATGSCF